MALCQTSAPGEVLGDGLGTGGHELAVRQRGEPRRAHADRPAAAQTLPPGTEHHAVPQVQHPLVLEYLAVGERERAAGHHQAQAGPVGRRDGLAEGRVAGPVAEHAGDEGGRRADRRALLERAARARLAVGHREPGLDLALAERVEPLDLEPPGGVARRLREAALRDDLAHRELVVEDVEEPDGAAAGVQHLRRHPGRLAPDTDERRSAKLGDEHGRVGPPAVGHGAEGVAEHQQVARLPAAPQHQRARHGAQGVALAGEADVDVAHVAVHGRVREAGLSRQLARQLDHAVETVEAGGAQPLVHHALQLRHLRARRLGPARHEVHRAPVQVAGHQPGRDTRRREPLEQRLRGGGQMLLLERRRVAALEQTRAGRSDHVHLGAAGEVEEETALHARTRAQLLVHLANVRAADDGHVHAERREPLDAAAHGRGVVAPARHRGAVPGEADHRELALQHARKRTRAGARPARARLARDLVAAARHRPTILPHVRPSCTGRYTGVPATPGPR